MARKAKKQSENIAAQTAAPTVDTTLTVTPKLIVAQRSFNRWYVYFKGVQPSENVRCCCKSAKSAIRYMHLLGRFADCLPYMSGYNLQECFG